MDLSTHEGRLAAIRTVRDQLPEEFVAALELARKKDPFPVIRILPDNGGYDAAIYDRQEFLRMIDSRENSPEMWDLLTREDHPPGVVFFVLIHLGEHSFTRTLLRPKPLPSVN
jgi:hypothetical protein